MQRSQGPGVNQGGGGGNFNRGSGGGSRQHINDDRGGFNNDGFQRGGGGGRDFDRNRGAREGGSFGGNGEWHSYLAVIFARLSQRRYRPLWSRCTEITLSRFVFALQIAARIVAATAISAMTETVDVRLIGMVAMAAMVEMVAEGSTEMVAKEAMVIAMAEPAALAATIDMVTTIDVVAATMTEAHPVVVVDRESTVINRQDQLLVSAIIRNMCPETHVV